MDQIYGFAPKPFEKRRSLAVTSVVLGAVSSVCCATFGIGIIPALIGTIFGIIAIVSGSQKSRRLGIIGLVLSAIGLIVNSVIIVRLVMIIDWNKISWDILLSFVNIDRNNPAEIKEWLQQFLKIDILSQ